MRILLVRHTSVAVEPGICYGQTDVDVNPSFPEEAAIVKKNIEDVEPERIEKAFTSPLSRCRKLAAFCGYENAEPDNRLLELNFGAWEMKRFDEIDDPRLQVWYGDYINNKAGGGESFIDQQTRLLDFFRSLEGKPYNTVIVFCHAGIVMQSLLLAGRVTADKIFEAQPPYGGMVEFQLSEFLNK